MCRREDYVATDETSAAEMSLAILEGDRIRISMAVGPIPVDDAILPPREGRVPLAYHDIVADIDIDIDIVAAIDDDAAVEEIVGHGHRSRRRRRG